MDLFDYNDDFINKMALAISRSYLVIICIDEEYETRPWCEAGCSQRIFVDENKFFVSQRRDRSC